MLFIYNKFKLRKWSKYSSVKRLKILQALENKLAKQNHRDPIDVVVHENSNWNCFGMFTVQNGVTRLYVHENLILNAYNEGIFNYLLVLKYRDRERYYFVNYEAEGLKLLVFEED